MKPPPVRVILKIDIDWEPEVKAIVPKAPVPAIVICAFVAPVIVPAPLIDPFKVNVPNTLLAMASVPTEIFRTPFTVTALLGSVFVPDPEMVKLE